MQAKVKTKGAAQPLVVSANRLRDGAVVWLADGGRWADTVAEAAVFLGEAGEQGMAQAAAAEAAQLVVGGYLIEVAVTPHGPAPLRARERFRAGGPTTLTQAA
jgi:sulfite reductase (NADPH) hemoprotein beta-component